jgi:hypothetical protein
LIHHSPSQNPSSGGERNACNPLDIPYANTMSGHKTVLTRRISLSRCLRRRASAVLLFFRIEGRRQQAKPGTGERDRTKPGPQRSSKGRLQSGVNVMHSSQKQDNCFSNNKRCTCVGFLEAMASANDPCLPPPHVSVRGGKPRLWTEAEKVLESGEGPPISCSLPCLASHGRRHETRSYRCT